MVDEENLTEEEQAVRAEEKKKMDMMKKFYRNRYTSFIKTLAEQKSRKLQAEESLAKKDAEAKKKEKIKSKVIDASQIQSKFMQPKSLIQEEDFTMIQPILPSKKYNDKILAGGGMPEPKALTTEKV